MEESGSAHAVSEHVRHPEPGAFGSHGGRREGSGSVRCSAGHIDRPSGASRALRGAPVFNEHGAHEDFIRYQWFE